MSAPLFSILHPTARPKEWSKSYVKWVERAASNQNFEYVLCIDKRWGFDSDSTNPTKAASGLSEWTAGAGPVNRLKLRQGQFDVWCRNTGRKCWVDAANEAARHARGHILILNSDDMEPTEKWDHALVESFPLEWGNAKNARHSIQDAAWHVSTGYYDGPQASSIQIMSRARYERLGYILYPEYESLYADDDMLQHAYHDGVVIDARHLMFPHTHAKVGNWDAVYEHQNREEARRLGREVLERRKANGFSK
jgi:hypothetical protein